MSHELFAHAQYAAEDEAAADASAQAEYEAESRQEDERIARAKPQRTLTIALPDDEAWCLGIALRLERGGFHEFARQIVAGLQESGGDGDARPAEQLGLVSPDVSEQASGDLLAELRAIRASKVTVIEQSAVDDCIDAARTHLGGGK